MYNPKDTDFQIEVKTGNKFLLDNKAIQKTIQPVRDQIETRDQDQERISRRRERKEDDENVNSVNMSTVHPDNSS